MMRRWISSFAKVLAGSKIKLKVHLGLYDDETAQFASGMSPRLIALNRGATLRAFDGTARSSSP